jgi:hypothetical protein
VAAQLVIFEKVSKPHPPPCAIPCSQTKAERLANGKKDLVKEEEIAHRVAAAYTRATIPNRREMIKMHNAKNHNVTKHVQRDVVYLRDRS